MLVLREGAGVGGARLYCSGKDANAATNAGGVVPRHTHSEARGCSSVSQTVMLEVGGQRSVTLFSSAAAICWSRKASCIF